MSATFRLIHLLQSRTGRIILALVLGASIFIGIGYYLRDLTAPNPPPPPANVLTITLTWDQWNDAQNAIWFIQGEISTTLSLAGDSLPPEVIAQSHTTIQQFEDLKTTLVDQAFAQTTDLPTSEINPILDHQLQRQEDLVELLTTLDQARLDWLIEAVP